MRGWDVVVGKMNGRVGGVDKVRLRRYMGEKVDRSIGRNWRVGVGNGEWWVRGGEVVEEVEGKKGKVRG